MKWIAGLLAFVAVLVSSGGAVPVLADTPPSGPSSAEVDQGPLGAGRVRHPLFVQTDGRTAAGEPKVTSTVPSGYTPAQIQAYLGLGGNGAGQTIAIVDAFDHPSVASDLNLFSQQFGLPMICGSAGADPANCFTFIKAMPQGTPSVDPGWALEIALDVQWAHAVAPKAKILLVEAATNSLANLLSAVDYAAGQGASVISLSWGTNEFSSESLYDSHCRLAAAVCTAASGDAGNPGIWPAYDPYVLAVGGTTLSLGAGGAVSAESAWSGSGGGVSLYEGKPSYQNLVNSYAKRGIPDVSYDADPATGFAVYDTVAYSGQTGWFRVGGTSAGAPQWAAIIAVANQLRAAAGQPPFGSSSFQIHQQIYALTAGLADITSGTNGSCGTVCAARSGYDFVTGLGSPRAGVDAALASVVAPTPDFALSATPASRSINPGGSTSYTVNVAASGGFSGAVSLSLSGQPAGVSGSFSANPATSSSTLAITSTSAAPVGTYTLTVTGTSGSLTHTATVSLTISATSASDFAISSSVSSLTVRRSSSGTTSVTVRSLAGFSAPVVLSVVGLPAGVSARFGSASLKPAPNGTATTSLRITTSFFSPRGTYTIMVTGTSGALTHSTPLTLTIQ